jgi:tartrate dehydrogenase/decarboxylase/D-malate dehydrogenase
MLFVRENTEGEYAGSGGRLHPGPHEIATEVSVFTRRGCERVIRHAFRLAAARRSSLVSATKSSTWRYGFGLWDQVVEEIADEFPGVHVASVHIDALCARLVRDPGSVDVVVASNMFGDILTDLAGTFQGGLGMSPSSNVAPDMEVPGMFEPIHGSAPDIAGQGVANPCATIWAAAMMLEHLGEADAAGHVIAALENVCRSGPRTPEVSGSATTSEVGDAIAAEVRTLAS